MQGGHVDNASGAEQLLKSNTSLHQCLWLCMHSAIGPITKHIIIIVIKNDTLRYFLTSPHVQKTKNSKGCAMAQMVSCWPLTAEGQIRAWGF
jgi:hypothetical protein